MFFFIPLFPWLFSAFSYHLSFNDDALFIRTYVWEGWHCVIRTEHCAYAHLKIIYSPSKNKEWVLLNFFHLGHCLATGSVTRLLSTADWIWIKHCSFSRFHVNAADIETHFMPCCLCRGEYMSIDTWEHGLLSAGHLHEPRWLQDRAAEWVSITSPVGHFLCSSTLGGLELSCCPVHTVSLETFQHGALESPDRQSSRHCAGFSRSHSSHWKSKFTIAHSCSLKINLCDYNLVGVRRNQIVALVADEWLN